MKLQKKIARKVRQLRTEQDLSKTEMSARTGIPRRTLARIEAADVQDYTPTLATLQALAPALGMKVVHSLV